MLGKFNVNALRVHYGRYGTLLGKKDFKVLELHFTEGQIVVF